MSRVKGGDVEALLQRFRVPVESWKALAGLLDVLANPNAPTSVHDHRHAAEVHLADSLVALEVDEVRSASVIADLGAGAGLPGLVLAAVLPHARVVLVESAGRKCEFLRAAVVAMELDNVDVVWRRAEEWREGIGRCDVVCARALAALPVLCEYAAPLLRDAGVLVAWKGEVAEAEAADSAAAAAHLGLAVEAVRRVAPYPGSQRRTLHVLRKVVPTPANFPRRAGSATKRPLSAKDLRRWRTN
ncbi:MAG: 16S rRNA (guanine(527)-N(7))-methyltransferase RsmG [Solirubrobacteraceae bacterium]